ncbi:carboxylate-amine ligase [Thermogemmatispora sp.]|uniref:carboxylate-amine ligase n=1 Tax=Thermogemmatispora sp. TaxID=1968838 RepID=UPI001D53E34C|nr:carboxylate-amine ligase [Thermogemmatispora sp.]MBX5449191.1 carboxylate-amine ligase [Thermogemmatispora sp.]
MKGQSALYRPTLGVEEEFQLVERRNGQLCSAIERVLEKGQPLFGEQIKPEMHASTVEIISPVCPDIAAVRQELSGLRRRLIEVLATEDLVPVSAGTHPTAHWQDQQRTERERYAELEEEEQDVGRSLLIFGLHIHVGIPNREVAIAVMNQARLWLPHLLALSANSPFWAGRLTGIKSYRSVVWKRCNRSGLPEVLPNLAHFERYVDDLIQVGAIDNGKRIWWDIRLHPFFDTLEFRICDMPATLEDTLALTALCQALVAKLCLLHQQGVTTFVLPRLYIEENKWLAMRDGLDATYIDFPNRRRLSMREAIAELLDFVADAADELGSQREMAYLRALLTDPRGTGADRQIAVYRQTGDMDQVMRLLIEQTTQGVLEVA